MKKKILDIPKDRVNDVMFIHFWEQFSPDLALRINLKESHYQQLKLLCDQMVEYELLNRIVKNVGYTYDVQDRILERPEIKLKSKALENIVKYSRLLNIEPFKDSTTTDGSPILSNGSVGHSGEEEF